MTAEIQRHSMTDWALNRTGAPLPNDLIAAQDRLDRIAKYLDQVRETAPEPGWVTLLDGEEIG